ncbi:MAG: ABC transporter ATP-binding protein [Lachnospiraceae bacterium]|nr:ABC transporter ATP-binding protein [Lachnospiraceae bacterium]
MIEIRDMCKVYNPGENEVRALNHISLDIGEKEFVAIIGQSGSGKSTLMNMLGCLDVPTSGSYRLHGKDVAEMLDDELSDIRNKEIGFIFQGFNLISSLTALENVELPLIYRGLPKKERSELAKEALSKVGLEKRMTHKPSEMSGGQQQRVAIARAIAQAPPIILADEPTGNLDSHSSVEILEILRQLHEEGRTVIIITHDPGIAAKASRIVHIMDGQIYKDEINSGEDESAIRAELAKAQENVTTKVKSVRHHDEEDDLVVESYSDPEPSDAGYADTEYNNAGFDNTEYTDNNTGFTVQEEPATQNGFGTGEES